MADIIDIRPPGPRAYQRHHASFPGEGWDTYIVVDHANGQDHGPFRHRVDAEKWASETGLYDFTVSLLRWPTA